MEFVCDVRRLRYEAWWYHTPCWLSRTISKGERCSEKQNKTIHTTTESLKSCLTLWFSALWKSRKEQRGTPGAWVKITTKELFLPSSFSKMKSAFIAFFFFFFGLANLTYWWIISNSQNISSKNIDSCMLNPEIHSKATCSPCFPKAGVTEVGRKDPREFPLTIWILAQEQQKSWNSLYSRHTSNLHKGKDNTYAYIDRFWKGKRKKTVLEKNVLFKRPLFWLHSYNSEVHLCLDCFQTSHSSPCKQCILYQSSVQEPYKIQIVFFHLYTFQISSSTSITNANRFIGKKSVWLHF